jgi:hypothetical protein
MKATLGYVAFCGVALEPQRYGDLVADAALPFELAVQNGVYSTRLEAILARPFS